MVVKAVRLQSVCELLRVGLSAQNTRGGAEHRLVLNTTSRRTRSRSLFTRETESLLSELNYSERDAAPVHHVFWANKTTLRRSCNDCNVTAVATMPFLFSALKASLNWLKFGYFLRFSSFFGGSHGNLDLRNAGAVWRSKRKPYFG